MCKLFLTCVFIIFSANPLPSTLYYGTSVPFMNTFLIVGGVDGCIMCIRNISDQILQYDYESDNWITLSTRDGDSVYLSVKI